MRDVIGTFLTPQHATLAFIGARSKSSTFGARLFVDAVWPAYVAQQQAKQSTPNTRKVSILLMQVTEGFDRFFALPIAEQSFFFFGCFWRA